MMRAAALIIRRQKNQQLKTKQHTKMATKKNTTKKAAVKATVKSTAKTTTKAQKTTAKTTTKAQKTTAKTAKAAPKAVVRKPAQTANHRILDFIESHGEVTKDQILNYYCSYVRPEHKAAYKKCRSSVRGMCCFPKHSSIWNPAKNGGRFLQTVKLNGSTNVYRVGYSK